MKKPLAQIIPLLCRGLPATAVASGLLSPLAMGASGDLDPSFADVGRKADLILAGPVWSLESLADDELLIAGGNDCEGWYCGYYDDYADNFVGRLSGTGSIDQAFTAAQLQNVEVLDVVLQADGKVIGIGRTVENDRDLSVPTIFRLDPDGALDLTFGEDGIVRGASALRNAFTGVVLEPDGRIVVAGLQSNRIIVRRFFPDGTRDDSFGTSGEFLGPASPFAQRLLIVRIAAGGYRITANSSGSCGIVALTAGGQLDGSFGFAGTAHIGGPVPAATQCNSLSAQSDDRLLVAGSEDDRGFVRRLLATGQTDSSFEADAVADTMASATAIAVGPDGSVVVAGQGNGVSGAVVMRLQATGALDALFGQSGSTWIDLPSESSPFPVIHDMTVLADRRVVAAGGYYGNSSPFVVRLLGDAGGNSPGVIGIKSWTSRVEEQSQQAVVTLRRTGGSDGSVSADYQTEPNEWDSATGGADYTEISGRLTWEDGDLTERQIVVPIAADGGVEGTEWFKLVLNNPQGDAGLGTRTARFEIAADLQQPAQSRSGGGALGLLSLLLLGIGRLLPFARRASG
jgi:uncharacterized delta-60 repeat protein